MLEFMFSPPPGIPARISRCIDDAQLSIYVCMYHFSESTIAKHMAAAVERGVKCFVVLDRAAAYETQSMAWQLAKTGVHTWLDAAHALMHCKYAIIDDLWVLTGSANWSYGSDGRAAEDFVIIGPDAAAAATYLADWEVHRSHSVAIPRS